MKKALTVIAVLNALSLAAATAEDGKGTLGHRALNNCSAGSARLSGVKGTVLLSRGGSFSEVREGTNLVIGDRILVRDGFANVIIGEHLISRVSSGSMATITERNGSVCLAQVSTHPAVVGQEEAFGVPPVVVAGGVAAIGLGVGLGIGLSNNGNNFNPSLPLALSP
jgi:hypothetical protein